MSLKTKTQSVLSRHVGGWDDTWAWQIVNEAAKNADFEQMREELCHTSDILKRVCHAITTHRKEIE